jgi:hypothetical protein
MREWRLKARLRALIARPSVRRLGIVVVALGAIAIAFAISVTMLDDPVSAALRERAEAFLAALSERLYERHREDRLTRFEVCLLHAATLAGVAGTRLAYPEASALLYHYVYGDGSPLELPSSYFRNSTYLKAKVRELGPGRHGPIGFEQSADWRLSLALNPYYLTLEGKRVRISHPRIEFASAKARPTRTVVPIGKLRIRVHDNLVSALRPTPFEAYAEWERQGREE